MVKKKTLKWSIAAHNDLKSVFDYICDVDCKRNAHYVITEIKKQAKEVLIFPESFPKEQKTDDNYIRYTLKWRYKIIFKIDIDVIYILRIFHTSQNPEYLTLDN